MAGGPPPPGSAVPERRGAALRSVWLLLWLAALAILVAGSLNPITRPPSAYSFDKLAHLLAYGALAAVPALLLRQGRHVLAAAFLLLAVGGGVEVLQSLVPGRMGSVADALANAAGVVLGLAAGRQARGWLSPGRRPRA
jgi:VanZ family protein